MTTPPNHNTADQSGADQLRAALTKILEQPNETFSDGKALAAIVKIARAALASTQPAAVPASFDLVALGIARRFTLDTEPQRRAALQCAVVTAMQAATPQPSAPAWQPNVRTTGAASDIGASDISLTVSDEANDYESLINELAAIRDLFPIPPQGSPLEESWAASMSDPMEVSGFVRKAIAAQTAPAVQNVQAGDLQQALKVTVTTMSETNGNVFSTAWLHYAGDSVIDGYEFYTDKIKGRVEYEAARLRRLLDPSLPYVDILSFDTDTAPSQPVAGKYPDVTPEPRTAHCYEIGGKFAPPLVLTDEQIDDVQEKAYQDLIAKGYNGGMGGFTWDRASARAIERAVLEAAPASSAITEGARQSMGEAINKFFGAADNGDGTFAFDPFDAHDVDILINCIYAAPASSAMAQAVAIDTFRPDDDTALAWADRHDLGDTLRSADSCRVAIDDARSLELLQSQQPPVKASDGERRYEIVRKLTVPQFAELYRRNIAGEGRFDDLVDQLASDAGRQG